MDQNFLDFSVNKILVTSASNGIGNSIARAFRHAKATVVIIDIQGSASDSNLDGMSYLQASLDKNEHVSALARNRGLQTERV